MTINRTAFLQVKKHIRISNGALRWKGDWLNTCCGFLW